MSRLFTFDQLVKGGQATRLPTDVRREILEIIAYLHPQEAICLATVSKEVQDWIERVIYKAIIFSGQRYFHNESPSPLQRFKQTIESRSAAFFAEHVKTLHFDGSYTVDDILPILDVCTGVTDFGCYARFESKRDTLSSHLHGSDEGASSGGGGGGGKLIGAEVFEYIHSLKLERLFISRENIKSLVNTAPLPGVKSSLLTLTHLAVTDGSVFPSARFPALTHIAVISPVDSDHSDPQRQAHKEQGLAQIKDALAKPQTQSIINMLNDTRSRQSNAVWGMNDERFVNFTLPMTPTKFIEDDLWDLAMTFPDEEETVRYLEDIPYPKILTYEELVKLEIAEKEKALAAGVQAAS